LTEWYLKIHDSDDHSIDNGINIALNDCYLNIFNITCKLKNFVPQDDSGQLKIFSPPKPPKNGLSNPKKVGRKRV